MNHVDLNQVFSDNPGSRLSPIGICLDHTGAHVGWGAESARAVFWVLTCSVGDPVDQSCSICLKVGLVQIQQARHFDCGHLKLNS